MRQVRLAGLFLVWFVVAYVVLALLLGPIPSEVRGSLTLFGAAALAFWGARLK
jgi:hypothetical protein